MRVNIVFPKFTHVMDMDVLPTAGSFIHSELIGDDSDGWFVVDGSPILKFDERGVAEWNVFVKRSQRVTDADLVERISQMHQPMSWRDGRKTCKECEGEFPCTTRQEIDSVRKLNGGQS